MWRHILAERNCERAAVVLAHREVWCRLATEIRMAKEDRRKVATAQRPSLYDAGGK